MERYGSITTPVSVPRLIVGAMLAAGVAVHGVASMIRHARCPEKKADTSASTTNTNDSNS